MTVATTSTVPDLVVELVSALNVAGVPSHIAYPGYDAEGEMLVLGQVTWDDYRIATLTGNARKQRQEDWAVEFSLTALDPDDESTPANPAPVMARAFTLLGLCEGVLADNPKIAAGQPVQYVEIVPETAEFVVVNESAFGYAIAGRFEFHARLL